ncbi:unnamed protein product [Cyprideis torosa]|uniref:Uncharacterized protein n=1 Tax=Cyprideis torosa TaxID=163714 RepID=A0A7R8WGY5_9CRUS|nr:unnamed protein product [Cyprideis torosa]CAG0895876.1 unnamed protein product [Cyprideis torosa]
MGSEGYLINQFLCSRTNVREDQWGGSKENRMRFALEIVAAIRQRVSSRFLLIFRLSMLDLVENGSSWKDTVLLARALENQGIRLLNTGIGWHESRIPTIAGMVPQAAFAWVTERMKKEVSIPLIASNRINSPEIAETLLRQNQADLISMARPLLADPAFAKKARDGQQKTINTCIACNQACLDHVFRGKTVSCMVNPLACHETKILLQAPQKKKNILVVGAGVAGLAFAEAAAQRGHRITLVEKAEKIGGQFNLAKQIPGKQEYNETLRYFNTVLPQLGVRVVTGREIAKGDFESFPHHEIVLATGVRPRIPAIEGIHHPMVITYEQLISGEKQAGACVAVLGGGGIGFDVCTLLSKSNTADQEKVATWLLRWGVDPDLRTPGGIVKKRPLLSTAERKIFLLQRSADKFGAKLQPTTGWIHRLSLRQKKVDMRKNLSYEKIDDQGLHLRQDGSPLLLEVDTIVLCTGQVENIPDYSALHRGKKRVHTIGGARLAQGLDAKRAIKEAVELAAIF